MSWLWVFWFVLWSLAIPFWFPSSFWVAFVFFIWLVAWNWFLFASTLLLHRFHEVPFHTFWYVCMYFPVTFWTFWRVQGSMSIYCTWLWVLSWFRILEYLQIGWFMCCCARFPDWGSGFCSRGDWLAIMFYFLFNYWQSCFIIICDDRIIKSESESQKHNWN